MHPRWLIRSDRRSWNSTLKFSITEVQLSARYYDSFAIILTMHAYFIVRLVKIGLGSWRLFCSKYVAKLSSYSPQRSSTQTKLAGVDNVAIANDYSLTRVGREPAREKIMERLSKEPLFASNNEAALIMFTCRYVLPTILAVDAYHIYSQWGNHACFLGFARYKVRRCRRIHQELHTSLRKRYCCDSK